MQQMTQTARQSGQFRHLSRGVIFFVLVTCIATLTACKPNSDVEDVTLSGETFHMPTHHRFYEADQNVSFYVMASDLGHNIPDRKNEEVDFVFSPIRTDINILQQPPHGLVKDGTRAHEQIIDGIEYLGSNHDEDHFLSHSDHKYFNCSRFNMVPNPQCVVEFPLDAKVSLRIWFSRKHIADFPLIVNGVTKVATW
jgi:hypothetical protein